MVRKARPAPDRTTQNETVMMTSRVGGLSPARRATERVVVSHMAGGTLGKAARQSNRKTARAVPVTTRQTGLLPAITASPMKTKSWGSATSNAVVDLQISAHPGVEVSQMAAGVFTDGGQIWSIKPFD